MDLHRSKKTSCFISLELQREIILRLPAEPLLRFRSVCKPWLRTIDDPSFARSHFNKNQCSSSPNLLIRTDTDTAYSFSLDSLNQIDGETTTIDALRLKTLVRPDLPGLPEKQVATCDGLLLFYGYEKKWVIWNPTTGDFHELPKLLLEGSIAGYGIWYDSASDDYRVVRIDSVRGAGGLGYVYRTLVYSLRLNKWKKIMNCPFDCYYRGSEAVFFNNALHWRSLSKIVVLDLATEEFRELPMPPYSSLPNDTHLDVFDGCLVLSEAHATKQAWVMEDYGVEPKWVELFSSEERRMIGGSTSGRVWPRVWPVAYSKTQRHLILQHENEIIFWDIEKCSAKKVTIHGLVGSFSSQICPASLCRLNGSVKGRKRLRGEASTRLKFSVTTTTDIPFLSDSDSSSSEAEEASVATGTDSWDSDSSWEFGETDNSNSDGSSGEAEEAEED